MKKWIGISLICFILLFSFSCTGKGKLADIDTRVTNSANKATVTAKYEEQDLLKITDSYDSMKALDKAFPIECVKKYGSGYRVSFFGEDRVAVLYFDLGQSKSYANVYSMDGMKSDFEKLGVGESVSEVQKAFPNGDYSFLYAGRNDAKRESTHYTKDGYLVLVRYDDHNCVIRIDSEFL